MIFIIVVTVLSLDQLAKFIITKNLELSHSLPVIKGIFHLTLVHNTGAAFGILKNQLALFISTSVFAIILIYFNLKDNKHKKYIAVSMSLILAGALGNLCDRLFFGYVIDYLDFRIWPVFNIADISITIGAILLGWQICTRKSVK